MRKLTALVLSDGLAGHFHLAEGIVTALRRLGPVRSHRFEIRRRRKWLPRRLLPRLLAQGAPGVVLGLGYGIGIRDLPRADLVISAGGDTIEANAAAARLRGIPNVFYGTLRRVPAESFDLVLTSYAEHSHLSRHAVVLKPSAFDPDDIPSRIDQPFGPAHLPHTAGLLIGGDCDLFDYQEHEWDKLFEFLQESRSTWGTRWFISTSRRTAGTVVARAAALAASHDSPICRFIDFRKCGPGTLVELFAASDVVLCTADSSTMLSEAVCARRPVIGVAPKMHGFKPEERGYRQYLCDQGWCRYLSLDTLSTDTFLQALASITPRKDSLHDGLADLLWSRLPGLRGNRMRLG